MGTARTSLMSSCLGVSKLLTLHSLTIITPRECESKIGVGRPALQLLNFVNAIGVGDSALFGGSSEEEVSGLHSPLFSVRSRF
jgi:hypothetical protein